MTHNAHPLRLGQPKIRRQNKKLKSKNQVKVSKALDFENK